MNADPSEDAEVKIVFNNIKSIMNGRREEKAFCFRNIPVDDEITVVGIKYQDNKPMLATKKTTITKNGTIDLEYKSVTLEELKSSLARL